MTSSPVNGYEKNGLYRLIHDIYVLLDYGDRLILEKHELTPTQFRLLNLIDIQAGLRLTTLSDRLLRSKSQVTRVVDSLEEIGLVIRSMDTRDRRAQKVVLTESGQNLRAKINEEHQQSLEARLGLLDEREQQVLVKIFDKLKHGMAKYLELE